MTRNGAMPSPIDRYHLQRLLAEGAQLVEVLPEDEFRDEHLPEAIHLGLKALNAETARRLDPERPVIVYCWDALCDMSPRAAWRLEALGFSPVYDYVTGKADWLAAGLPTEGEGPRRTRVGDVMDQTVPTCAPEDRVRDVAARLGGAWDICVVINDNRVVQGRLRRDRLDVTDDRAVAVVMEPGPATVRADADLAETIERMQRREVLKLIVSTPDGVLLGTLRTSGTRGLIHEGGQD
jgi:rhodanese-related sulfurtransferase